MISQKDIVVKMVKELLDTRYNPTEACLPKLSSSDLILLASDITSKIINKEVFYGKLNNNEPTPSRDSILKYVKSMIKNHLIKAKELNGNNAVIKLSKIKTHNNVTQITSKINIPEGIDQEFIDFIKLAHGVSV